jgi:hypothetical protein
MMRNAKVTTFVDSDIPGTLLPPLLQGVEK